MKKLILFAFLILWINPLFAQLTVPLDEVVHVPDVFTFDSTTGAESTASTTPKCSVYEEDTDTPIISLGSMILRTATTNDYRYSFTASSVNGFEVGKWYNVNCYAKVGSLDGDVNKMHFRVTASEFNTGYIATDMRTIQKNVAGQQLGIVFKSSAGTNVTGISTANITCTISKDFGAPVTTNDTTEAEVGGGLYYIDLTQAETNANWIYVNCHDASAMALDYSALINPQH